MDRGEHPVTRRMFLFQFGLRVKAAKPRRKEKNMGTMKHMKSYEIEWNLGATNSH